VNSVFNALPTFTISRIEIINCQTRELYKLNNPEPSMVLPRVLRPQSEKVPSTLSTFTGRIIAFAGQFGASIPKRYADYVAIKCRGSFNNFKNMQKVRVGWIVVIYVGQSTFIKARFLEVNTESLSGAIVVNDSYAKDFFKIGFTYPLLDGFWGKRAGLVLDVSRNWQRIEFQPRDAVFYHNDGRVEDIKNGWTHEHCLICMQTISTDEPENKFGYKDQDDVWICQSCYEKFVLPKSLEFINLNNVF
jgi:hypothetical protein